MARNDSRNARLLAASDKPEHRYIPARTRTRHDCSHYAPPSVVVGINNGDKWVCPACRRRWTIVDVIVPGRPPNPGMPYEGEWFRGPDGSTYWRAYRARFVGALG